MLRFSIRRILLACAVAILAFAPAPTLTAAPSADAVARCDTLASDPRDPGRYAAGVTEEQFAPGPAIEACKAAVDASPDLARSWFQLGRAYRVAERDADAFSALMQAAKRGYAPAMKYVGDAYKDGRGLPTGEHQSLETALVMYKKAKDAGLREADRAIQDVIAAIAANTFDPSIFQNPEYMTRLYSGQFDGIENPVLFFAYTKAFLGEIGGTNVFFIDQACRGMATALGHTVNGFGEMMGYLEAVQGDDVVKNLFVAVIGSKFTQDQGDRDAAILMHRYTCDNPVTRKIIDNVSGNYKKLPAIINAFTNSRAAIERRMSSLKVTAQNNCSRNFDRPGFCDCVFVKLKQANLTEAQWNAISTTIHGLGAVEVDRPELIPQVRACYRTPT